MMKNIEELKNELNLAIRSLGAVVNMIDGTNDQYADYKENSLSDEEFFKSQIEIINKLKEKLVDIFRD